MIEALAGKAVGSLFGGLGSALGGGGGPFQGGNAQSGAYGVSLEKGGTVYNFGGQAVTDTTSTRTTSNPAAPSMSAGLLDPEPMQAGMSPWMMVALGLVAFGMWKRAQ